jgi:hypothetical protein
MAQTKPASPPTLRIAEALDRCEPLARLTEQIRESQARYAVALPCLPPALQSSVKPGPVDGAAWSLLAANGAVASKLRHLVPLIESRLQDAGWPPVTIRIRVYTA